MAARRYLRVEDLLTYFDNHDISTSDSDSGFVVFDNSAVLEGINTVSSTEEPSDTLNRLFVGNSTEISHTSSSEVSPASDPMTPSDSNRSTHCFCQSFCFYQSEQAQLQDDRLAVLKLSSLEFDFAIIARLNAFAIDDAHVCSLKEKNWPQE